MDVSTCWYSNHYYIYTTVCWQTILGEDFFSTNQHVSDFTIAIHGNSTCCAMKNKCFPRADDWTGLRPALRNLTRGPHHSKYRLLVRDLSPKIWWSICYKYIMFMDVYGILSQYTVSHTGFFSNTMVQSFQVCGKIAIVWRVPMVDG